MTPLLTRRQLLSKALGAASLAVASPAGLSAASFGCTPAPEFPVPLTEGTWRSGELPIGKHNYHVWLKVDRRLPLDQLDCDLGPPQTDHTCSDPPLVDVTWKVWNGPVEVKRFEALPIQAAAWGSDSTNAFLGDFEGIRSGRFVFEWIVRKDAGRLKGLHPRVLIVKNPGYWCWL